VSGSSESVRPWVIVVSCCSSSRAWADILFTKAPARLEVMARCTEASFFVQWLKRASTIFGRTWGSDLAVRKKKDMQSCCVYVYDIFRSWWSASNEIAIFLSRPLGTWPPVRIVLSSWTCPNKNRLAAEPWLMKAGWPATCWLMTAAAK
jgi:hypothetical protein